MIRVGFLLSTPSSLRIFHLTNLDQVFVIDHMRYEFLYYEEIKIDMQDKFHLISFEQKATKLLQKTK